MFQKLVFVSKYGVVHPSHIRDLALSVGSQTKRKRKHTPGTETGEHNDL